MQATGKRMLWKKSDGKFRKKRGKRSSGRNQVNTTRNRGRLVYLDAGKQALKDVNYLRRFLNTEIKCLDTNANLEASSTTATFNLLNGMGQGTANAQRIGQSVKCDGIYVRFAIVINAASTTAFERLLVVQDKQPNAAIFAIGLLLNTTTIVSPYLISGQNRFAVLLDEAIALTNNGDQALVFDRSIPCNSHTEYNGSSNGNVSDIATNSIYFIHFSDQGANTVGVTYYFRYWYVDN